MLIKIITNFFFSIILIFSFISCAGIQFKSKAEAEFDEGLSLFNRGRYEEAIPHFELATEYDPEYGNAYLYLARSYLNLGNWKQALPPLRTAFRIAPDETRKEVADILMDFLLHHATTLDPEEQIQIRDLLRGE